MKFLQALTFDIIVNGIRATPSGYYFYKYGQKKSIGTQGIRDNLAVLDYIHIKDCTRFSWVLSIVTY